MSDVSPARPVGYDHASDTGDEASPGSGTPLLRRRSVRAGGVVVLVAAAVVATYLATRSSGAAGGSAAQQSTALVTVRRRDLVETASYDGTVDYADQRDIPAELLSGTSGSGGSAAAGAGSGAAGGSGVVTAIAPVGAIIRRGGTLFAVDAQPTVLMYGAFPAYRTLAAGVTDGPDVKELQQNLAALGYISGSYTPTGTWDTTTTAGVDGLEAALGLPEDGRVPFGRVVFAPGPVRIYGAASLGDTVASGSRVVTISSTVREATVALTASDAAIVGVGDPVTVTLPSGRTVAGHVATVGTAATAASSAGGGGAGSQGGAVNQTGASSATSGATIDVTIRLASGKGLGSIATAPVTVAFTQQRARNVLAVPTTALLTLADGTFAVEVDRGGGSTQLVRVTPGLFAAGGFVGITGNVRAGDRVVVPQ